MTHASGTLPAQKWPPTTVAQANAISALTDPALRNLKITQSYHDLKLGLTRLFGAKNVTWCAYATWASKTAGTFIRGEEAPRLIHDCIASLHHLEAAIDHADEALKRVHPSAGINRSVITCTIEEVLTDVTKHIGQGNLLVFQELAPLYAAWIETWKAPPPVFDQRAIDTFIASHFTPGPVEKGGQDLLIQAFRGYYDAMFEEDGGRKAQRMLLANALVGYHEQTRLGGPIVGALNAPLVNIFLSQAKLYACKKLPPFLHATIDPVINEILRPLAQQMEKAWHRVSTRCLMTLSIPDVTLDLGRDVPPLSPEQMFPYELERATFPPLVEILAKLDRIPDNVAGSAAGDWGDLDDRMAFIVDFFRTRQQDRSLYEQPFTDAQVAVILEGRIPGGRL